MRTRATAGFSGYALGRDALWAKLDTTWVCFVSSRTFPKNPTKGETEAKSSQVHTQLVIFNELQLEHGFPNTAQISVVMCPTLQRRIQCGLVCPVLYRLVILSDLSDLSF